MEEIFKQQVINDLRSFDPVVFINNLKELPINIPRLVVPIETEGWITDEHLPVLMSMISSKTKTKYVMNAFTGYGPNNGTSTLGNEARYLLYGYISGKYPPSLCSVIDFKLSGINNPNYFYKWCGEYKKK
jgi:hypothetical protein